MRIKIIIEDGVIQDVLGDSEAQTEKPNIELINFDTKTDSNEALIEEYEEPDMKSIEYTIKCLEAKR